MEAVKESFFTKDKTFYKTLFSMLLIVALQNVVTYSVNMIDNIMLGRLSQEALSGAATVNQVFFMVDQFALSIGNTLVAITSQYWGQKKLQPIRTLTGIALKLGIIVSFVIIAICGFFPEQVLHIFTNSPEIIAEIREIACPGTSATKPVKISNEIPLPIPFWLICSPIHIIKAVPAVRHRKMVI